MDASVAKNNDEDVLIVTTTDKSKFFMSGFSILDTYIICVPIGTSSPNTS